MRPGRWSTRAAAVAIAVAIAVGCLADEAVAAVRWPPPALDHPDTIQLADEASQVNLDPARDYRLVLPDHPRRGGLVINGGHNVVLIGGRIEIPPGETREIFQRGVYVLKSTGTVHIEGVEIDGSGSPSDGIAINAPDAVVQIENVRITGLHGSYDGYHADAVQPWGGVRDLRVDHLSVESDYQGLFLRPDLGRIGSVELSDVDLRYTPDAGNHGGTMLWLSTGCDAPPVKLQDVYIWPTPGQALGRGVWPAQDDPACGADVAGPAISWPTLRVTGHVLNAAPPDGEFVPTGTAGTNYQAAQDPAQPAPGAKSGSSSVDPVTGFSSVRKPATPPIVSAAAPVATRQAPPSGRTPVPTTRESAQPAKRARRPVSDKKSARANRRSKRSRRRARHKERAEHRCAERCDSPKRKARESARAHRRSRACQRRAHEKPQTTRAKRCNKLRAHHGRAADRRHRSRAADRSSRR